MGSEYVRLAKRLGDWIVDALNRDMTRLAACKTTFLHTCSRKTFSYGRLDIISSSSLL